MSLKENYKKKAFVHFHGFLYHIEPAVAISESPKDLIQTIVTHLDQFSFKKILLISSSAIKDHPLLEKINKLSLRSNISFVSYPITDNQASVFHVEKAVHTYVSKQCQAILIIGDGAAIDLGKALKARILNQNTSLSQMEGLANIPIRKREPLLFIAPLSLSGKQANLSTSILDHVQNKMIFLADRIFSADYIFYCPSLLTTLTLDELIGSYCMALATATEALVSKNSSTDSREEAKISIQMFLKALENPVFLDLIHYKKNEVSTSSSPVSPQHSREERIAFLKNLFEASHLAGKASAKSLTGYVTALTNALEVHYQVVDYKIIPILFLATLKMYLQHLANSEKNYFPENEKKELQTLFEEIKDALIKLISDFNLAQHLSFIQVHDYGTIIKMVLKEMADYYTCPFELNEDNLSAILKSLQ